LAEDPAFSDTAKLAQAGLATTNAKRYRLVHMADIAGTPCPCGLAKRAFTDEPDQITSMHVTEIHHDSKTHYHKTMTELYYVLSGEGTMELDGDSFLIQQGSAIMIRPGCRHRAVGKLTMLIVPIPAFDPNDEWFD
jgi:mannose-6-phosphate isomerase-like protein (cupin superfamily)